MYPFGRNAFMNNYIMLFTKNSHHYWHTTDRYHNIHPQNACHPFNKMSQLFFLKEAYLLQHFLSNFEEIESKTVQISYLTLVCVCVVCVHMCVYVYAHACGMYTYTYMVNMYMVNTHTTHIYHIYVIYITYIIWYMCVVYVLRFHSISQTKFSL